MTKKMDLLIRSLFVNQIRIDPERILSDIDRNIFGWHAESEVYGGIYCPDSALSDKDGLRSDVRAALERLKHSNVRFPGGNFASSYHWIDGVGPREKRPSRYSLSWRHTVSNHFGTNEFIQFCRKINTEPYLLVNCGDGDMREAADWVEYCNGTGDTALVTLRREHGFEAPHKVKYWGVGNEVDGPGQVGRKTAQEYARAFTEFSKVMKRVDPDIKLVASGVCNWEDNRSHAQSDWVERAQLMLEQAGDRIDYISIHLLAHPYDNDPFETIAALAEDFNERLSAYEGLIRAVTLEKSIKHAIGIAVDEYFASRAPAVINRDIANRIPPVNITRDEWGVMHLPESGQGDVRSHGQGWMRSNLVDAAVTALYLNAFIRHAHSVRLANTSPMMGATGTNNMMVRFIGAVKSRSDNPLVLPTIFYPFELYSRTCGQLALDVFWYGETFADTIAFRDRTYTGIRILDVAATLDKARKQMVVYVVNQSGKQSMETTISLTSGQFTGNVRVSVVNGQEGKTENTEEKPDQVGIREADLKVGGKSFTYTFEPHSVTALVCAIS